MSHLQPKGGHPHFVACPRCHCPARARDARCPSCNAVLRSADGSIARTAVAALLALEAATGLEGCASAPKYGAPATDGEPTATSTSTSPAPTASPTATNTAGPTPTGGPEVRPLYGVPATGGD